MQYKLFTIPVTDNEDSLKEMNLFLHSHKALEANKQIMHNSHGANWFFCFKYIVRDVRLKNDLLHKKLTNMKTYMKYCLLIFLLVFISCDNREWNNPFDPDCPKELFTPAGFTTKQEGNLVKLTWTQSNTQISGFAIERSIDGGATWSSVATPSKSELTWSDNNITAGKEHKYRLVAKAGNNISNEVTAQVTPVFAATITTLAVTSLTTNSATSGGNITSDGGAPVTARGVCWNTSANPTTTNSKTSDGTGTGSFTSNITTLTENTTYYVRSYAINSQGTTYGSEVSFKTNPILALATVTTSVATTFTTTTAVLGGNVTNDGNAEVMERGIVYATTQNPTTANTKVILGTGTGIFGNSVPGFESNTIYYVRAYAINSQGTAYGSEVSFKTNPTLAMATVTTTAVTTFTATSAVLGGNVTSDGNATVTERGVCYATTENPTTADSKLIIGNGAGAFSDTVIGLREGTTYYARAYVINSLGTSYGTQISFTTTQLLLATVSTTDVNNVTAVTAVLGGNVTNDGNATVTERGVCYSLTQSPTTANTKIAIGKGSGAFSNSVSGLIANTTYYVRAYAINSKGTAYGNEVSFKTGVVLAMATVITSTPANITSSSAVLGGDISSDGNATITERGVCYSTSQNPTTSNTKVVIGNGVGTFSNTITGFIANTTYYVRSYAINTQGTAYGNQVSFSSLGSIPTTSTKDATNILETSAIVGGIVLTDEGSAVTERGVCYSTSANPTIYDSKIASGSGVGGFNTPLNTLIPNMTYYVRAYATNKNGIAYGENKTFKTLDAYYAGFENGLPAGWSGMWTVSSDSAYDGFFCLKSVNLGDSIVFTRTITKAEGGQISFFYTSSGFYSVLFPLTTSFYIDNILQTNMGNEGWTMKTFSITSGTHKFKWINNGGGYYNNITYIDYFICPK
jgi:hypothetical protein